MNEQTKEVDATPGRVVLWRYEPRERTRLFIPARVLDPWATGTRQGAVASDGLSRGAIVLIRYRLSADGLPSWCRLKPEQWRHRWVPLSALEPPTDDDILRVLEQEKRYPRATP